MTDLGRSTESTPGSPLSSPEIERIEVDLGCPAALLASRAPSPHAAVHATAGRPSGAARDRHPYRRPERGRARRRRPRHDRVALEAARLHLPVVARSTAASTRSGTTARSASSSRTTSSAPGGGRWSRSATTSSGSMPGSSCTRRCGSRPGHVGSFSDPLVECATDHKRFRLDELPGAENLSATDLQDPTIVERLGLALPRRRRPAVGAAPVQPHVQDVHGPGRGGRLGHLPAARDRAGLVRQLQERPAVARARSCRSGSPRSASRSATRSARATSCSGCASSSRWRCSTSSGRRPRRPTRSRSGCRRAAPGTSATA